MIGLRDTIQHRCDVDEALQIGVDGAADLELEEGVAVVRDHVLERLRQAVADLARVAGDGIEEADGVARGNADRRRELRQEAPQVEAGEVARGRGQQSGIDAREVRAHRLVERTARAPAHGIEHGAVDADLQRLVDIAAVLDRIAEPYHVSLDGNEQYDDLAALLDLWQRMQASPRLARLVASILFIEQPINRKHALDTDVSALSQVKPVIIDESDADLAAFPSARALGYAGVSSKCCKGLYKSILNAARCWMWNAELDYEHYFMSGEDLTTQAGLAVQQDLALVNLLGLTHVERNGHHYVNGMAGLPQPEQDAFLAAHPDLYERSRGAVRLKIRDGRLAIGSLAGAGFASGADPDWTTLRPLAAPPQQTASAGG